MTSYFAIIPAAFATTHPALTVFSVMGLATPASAILAAVTFNALIIVALIPLALKGVGYRPAGATALLGRTPGQCPDPQSGAGPAADRPLTPEAPTPGRSGR